MTTDRWAEQRAGIDCYLCPPCLASHPNLTFIADLAVSSLYLEKDQRFRGLSCLILNDHVTRPDDLPEQSYTAFMQDLRRSIVAIRGATQPDHMNLALLGNSCPHLHWSIVPRYRSDSHWGQPIWSDEILRGIRDSPIMLSDAQYSDLVKSVREHL